MRTVPGGVRAFIDNGYAVPKRKIALKFYYLLLYYMI